MANDKNDERAVKSDDPAPSDAETSEEASRKAKREAVEGEELDEGLDESFPASDAPASTRRSDKA